MLELSPNVRAPRGLSITKVGWIFVALTLGVGVAAMNSGNNLLFLLLGGMLSFIVGSGLLSEAMLRYVEIERQLPKHLDANRRQPAYLEVKNKARWPVFSLVVRDFGRRLEPYEDEETSLFGDVFVGILGAETTDRIAANYRFSRRGRYRLETVVVETSFPFELFEKTRTFECETTVFAIPRRANVFEHFFSAEVQGRDVSDSSVGSLGDFYALRDYRHGDSMRHIYWKALAKNQTLAVKQRSSPGGKASRILFVNQLDDDCEPAAFECALRALRSVIEYAFDSGRLQLVTLNGSFEVQPGDYESLLRAQQMLATIRPVESKPMPQGSFELTIGPKSLMTSSDSGSWMDYRAVAELVRSSDAS